MSSSALSPSLQHMLFFAGMYVDGLPDEMKKEYHDMKITNKELRIHPWTIVSQTHSAFALEIRNGFVEFHSSSPSSTTGYPLHLNNTDLEYYEYYVKHLSPLFKYSEILLTTLNKEQFTEFYSESLGWTHMVDVCEEVFSLLNENKSSHDLLALLTLSSVLEQSLGNLFLMRGFQCPAMLKDLLTTKELNDILGHLPLQVLQLMIGPPISLNIRNVAWHGFFSAGELPRRYVYFLLLLTSSIGNLLNQRGYDTKSIARRDYVSLEGVHTIAAHFSDFTDGDFTSAKQLVLNSWIVDDSNRPIFTAAFDFRENQKYGKSTVLLLPLLEHTFRRLYVKVNECPARLITAETRALFTTFEEILSPCLADGQENKIMENLGEPMMDLVHDLLTYRSGPRCRDKISHGEANCGSINVALPNVLLLVFAWLAREEETEQKDFKHKLSRRIDSYTSVFHPIAVLRRKVLELCAECCQLLVALTLSPDLQPWSLSDGLDCFTKDNTTLSVTMTALSEFVSHTTLQLPIDSQNLWESLKSRASIPFSNVRDDVGTVLNSLRIKTLHRWKQFTQATKESNPRPTSAGVVSESEIVGLLTRITVETSAALLQTISALTMRRDHQDRKLLRSRHRENFRRLLLFAPSACLMVNYVTCLVTWMFSHLDNYLNVGLSEGKLLQKHLKLTLQSAENIRTYTGSDKNKWSEAGDLLLSEIQAASGRLKKTSYFTA